MAADALGLPLEQVSVRLGDTSLPESHASIGSATMANAGASVLLAAQATRDKAIELALTGLDAPFAGADASDVVAADGRLVLPARDLDITYAELLARNNIPTLIADGDYDPVEEALGPKAVYSFAAVFAEVRVDPDLGLVRLNRFGAFTTPAGSSIRRPPAAKRSAASSGASVKPRWNSRKWTRP